MDRRRQYELLPDEASDDQPVSAAATPSSADAVTVSLPAATPDAVSNLTYTRSGSTVALLEQVEQPPAYNVAVDLPTYEECLRAKQMEEEQRAETTSLHEVSPESRRRVEGIIGTDGMFMLGFIFAFLFNWVGLIAAFCLMRTCAGRFGALSGFGLSLVKWVAIAKRSNWSVGVADENPWVWWLLITFGILISCSGTLQYLRVKYLWARTRNANVITYPF